MIRRLETLIRELQAADRSGRLLGLVVGDLGGLQAARSELQRLTVDPEVRSTLLSFLESLQALRDLEREAADDARFFATARVM